MSSNGTKAAMDRHAAAAAGARSEVFDRCEGDLREVKQLLDKLATTLGPSRRVPAAPNPSIIYNVRAAPVDVYNECKEIYDSYSRYIDSTKADQKSDAFAVGSQCSSQIPQIKKALENALAKSTLNQRAKKLIMYIGLLVALVLLIIVVVAVMRKPEGFQRTATSGPPPFILQRGYVY